MGKADQTVEVWVDGEPADAGNPLPVTNPAGTGALTDDELRASPVKVDDDATQAILAAQLDLTLSALRDALRGGSSKTLTDLFGVLDGLEGSVDGLEALLAGGLPAALTSEGGLKVTLLPSAASGGLSTYETIDQQSGGDLVAAGAHQLKGYYIANLAATVRFVKLYDKATAPASTDTPKLVFPLPAGSAANMPITDGVAFTLGIGVRATTGQANNDNTAPTANDVVVNLFYK